MPTTDKQLVCRDCGVQFVFTSGEQAFFSSRGYAPPTRCPDCRKKRRFQVGGLNREPVETIVTCANCGTQGRVPFRLRSVTGILCAQCFALKQQDLQKKSSPEQEVTPR